MSKGQGIVTGWDGLCYKNALASYTHLHALGNEHWVEAMVRNAVHFREQRDNLPGSPARLLDRETGILQVSKRPTMI
jgi:cobyrinic acid a,c-diamide synthase